MSRKRKSTESRLARTRELASLQGYPNLTAAAGMLGVSVSTLSRRDDVTVEQRGDRDRVVPAGEVLRLATIYRKRSLNDVAQAVLDYATSTAPDEAGRVEQEVESFFEGRALSEGDVEGFVELARRLLPAALVREIQKAVEERGDDPPGYVQGWLPQPKS